MDGVRAALALQARNRMQRGRFYVLLTLAEGEAVRAALHAAALTQQPLAGRPKAAAALRALLPAADSGVVGASSTYAPAHPWMQSAAEACIRFFDCQPDYSNYDADALLNGIQVAEPKARSAFYEGVRACRRRRKIPWEAGGGGNLGVVLTVPDEQTLLIRRAALRRLCRALRDHNMLAADAFRAFDRSAKGIIGFPELAAGAQALGCRFTPAQATDLFKGLDSNGDDMVTLSEFRAIFTPAAIGLEGRTSGDGSDGTPLELDMSAFAALSLSNEDEEEEKAARQVVLPADIKKYRAKPKPAVCERAWSSLGTGSRDQASVWYPQLERSLLRRNRARVCITHYAAVGFDSPDKAPLPAGLRNRAGPLTLEIIDDGGSGITGSAKLPAVVRAAMPHPQRFQLAWSVQAGQQALYVWRALSPSPTHIPLGMVATNTDVPPPLTCMRCVPKRWLRPSKISPALVWENAGTGGRRGGLWIVNTLGCMEATTGGSLPTACCFDPIDKIALQYEDLWRPDLKAEAPGAAAQ